MKNILSFLSTSFFLFFAMNIVCAQDSVSIYKTQAKNDSGNIKYGEARCFMFSFPKEKALYSFLLISKDLINGFQTITFFFDNNKSIELPIDQEHIIQSANSKNPLVAIPFHFINEKDNTIQPTFLLEDFIPEIVNTSDANVEELKTEFEKWINKD